MRCVYLLMIIIIVIVVVIIVTARSTGDTSEILTADQVFDCETVIKEIPQVQSEETYRSFNPSLVIVDQGDLKSALYVHRVSNAINCSAPLTQVDDHQLESKALNS